MRGGALGIALLALPLRAETPEPLAPGFLCHGESESLLRGTTLDEIRFERDRRLSDLEAGSVPPALRAHTHCVVAVLMQRLGDERAAEHFEAAIEANPKEPAYELFFGRYLHFSRGASSPLSESAEAHYYATLDKLEHHHGAMQAGPTDGVTRAWTQRNLSLLYQEDGVALLPLDWKAYPYDRNARLAPQLFLSLTGSVASDTTDFWDPSDARRFTGELQNAAERRQAGGPPLTDAEVSSIARSTPRWDAQARLRLRQHYVGVLDATVRRATLVDSQITDLSQPAARNDVVVEELGFHARRTFDLYPLFDVMLDASYAFQERTGLVEGFPDLSEDVRIAQLSGALSRSIGPDKLTLGGSYVDFAIPDSPGGGPMAARDRVLRGAFIDYAVYRPLLLPQIQKGTFHAERKNTRGVHVFLAALFDDEQFGRTIVRKENLGGGAAFKGWLDYNLLLAGTYTSSLSEENGLSDPDQENSQWRTELVVTRRLVDEEAQPALPDGPFSSMQLVFNVRHDLALTGLSDYENVRGGVALWTKLFSSGLRGTSVLLNVGADYQRFYQLDKGLVSARLEVRMGWPTFGNIPALF
jgi:hypothetical protein